MLSHTSNLLTFIQLSAASLRVKCEEDVSSRLNKFEICFGSIKNSSPQRHGDTELKNQEKASRIPFTNLVNGICSVICCFLYVSVVNVNCGLQVNAQYLA
jgi:hypothetical protein